MAELRRADLARLIDLGARARAVLDPGSFAEAVLGPLRRLVPSDSITYNEIDTTGRGGGSYAVDPVDALDGTEPSVFERYVSQHPIISYTSRTGDGSAPTISDFVDQREFHRTDLYATYFRPARVERQIAITLSYGDTQIVGIALNRAARDYTQRDREVLNLARDQLVEGYEAARAAEARGILVAAMDRALDDHRRGVIVARTDGRLVAASPSAERLLATHLAVRATPGQQLPPTLAALVAAAPSRARPVALPGQGAVLHGSVLPDGDTRWRTIVIDERPETGSPPLSAAALTERERDVLRLLATGHSNAAIAHRLGVSIRTVHKHLEHLYPKLGVHDRTGAAAAWLAEHGSHAGRGPAS
jgi:DNA-binding CsgD family transcriptional regulator